MTLKIPEPSLVVLIGASGAGKSTFARKHFRASEILSSDRCRYLVCDDENDQTATGDAFEVLHCVAAKRLHRRKLTVIDATNVQRSAREPLIALARRYQVPAVAIVLSIPASLCLARNQSRQDRTLAPDVIEEQHRQMTGAIRNLQLEGFRDVFLLATADELESAQLERALFECGRDRA